MLVVGGECASVVMAMNFGSDARVVVLDVVLTRTVQSGPDHPGSQKQVSNLVHTCNAIRFNVGLFYYYLFIITSLGSNP